MPIKSRRQRRALLNVLHWDNKRIILPLVHSISLEPWKWQSKCGIFVQIFGCMLHVHICFPSRLKREDLAQFRSESRTIISWLLTKILDYKLVFNICNELQICEEPLISVFRICKTVNFWNCLICFRKIGSKSCFVYIKKIRCWLHFKTPPKMPTYEKEQKTFSSLEYDSALPLLSENIFGFQINCNSYPEIIGSQKSRL